MRLAFEKRQKFIPDRYQFREEKGWRWIQKLALWTLKKIGCHAFIMEETMVRSETINLHNLTKQIMEQQADTINWYHHHGDRLLVGPTEFAELSALPFTHPLSLDLQYMWVETDDTKYGMNLPPHTYTRFGLKVTVIPHMKGVLVLPKGWDR